MFRAERPRPAVLPVDTRPRWYREREEPPGVLAPGALAGLSALTALWPFTAVIAPGTWSFVSSLVIVAVVGTGALVRHLLRRRSDGVIGLLTLLAQVVVAVGVLTLLLAGDTAVLGIVPTSGTLTLFQALAAAAAEEIVFGSAPLDASPGLAAALGAGFAVVAILLDHLIAHRSAVLTTVLLGVIGAVPTIITLGSPNLAWFAAAAVVALLVFRFTARRHAESPRRASAGVAVAVGAAAIAATFVVTPLLPVGSTIAGTGVGVSVDASLRLGDDLRQPSPVEVLTVAAKTDAAPYLRLTTLSRFDGRVWQPDRGDLQSQVDGFGGPEWGEDVTTAEQTTSIRVLRMSSSWLPVPYPATDVQGLSAAWRVSPENRTLFSRRGDAVGNDYTVTSLRVTPTLEQIRAADAAPPLTDAEDDGVELPGIISELAAEVTAEEDTDYDRLIALQNWFRSQFEYSLETPVEEGFDGTGADAVARFLEERSGYCVHFAGSFALMAESLGMQVRIVVGYLPGTMTNEKRGDESIFSVSSDQLHSWPEVLFPGIGWVPFEPTASLGVPTAFRAGTSGSASPGSPDAPAPTTAPQTEETSAPELDRRDADAGSTDSGELRRLDPTPVLLTVLGVVVFLLLPGLIRLVERRLRMRRAARGDAAAAWAELRDTLIDLGIPVSDANSPRMRALQLVRDAGADEVALTQVITTVERASYARTSATEDDLAAPLSTVVRSLRAHVDRTTRARALLLPRSLYAPRGSDSRLLV
ncbi:transglutaminase family protein [Zhihengliuella sp. ISTPL4]|uniref:transglutaminase family protein n=1 Tax=Zhihengliuella sp. ISTPL4 TaxID=2058657 RepID=UPI000C7C3242|nr:DUF3488 and transglutaminase-like domain-containing protein [Zhihengliuella sp. ISTPL4]